jgi:hypothetical protein
MRAVPFGQRSAQRLTSASEESCELGSGFGEEGFDEVGFEITTTSVKPSSGSRTFMSGNSSRSLFSVVPLFSKSSSSLLTKEQLTSKICCRRGWSGAPAAAPPARAYREGSLSARDFRSDGFGEVSVDRPLKTMKLRPSRGGMKFRFGNCSCSDRVRRLLRLRLGFSDMPPAYVTLAGEPLSGAHTRTAGHGGRRRRRRRNKPHPPRVFMRSSRAHLYGRDPPSCQSKERTSCPDTATHSLRVVVSFAVRGQP